MTKDRLEEDQTTRLERHNQKRFKSRHTFPDYFLFRPNVCSKIETRSITKVVPCVKSYDHLVKVWSHNCTEGRRICPVYEHRFVKISTKEIRSIDLFSTEYYRSEQTISKEINVTTYHCCLGWTRIVHDYGCPIGKN